MAEVKTPAQLVLVNYICDNCNEGRMLPSGDYTITTYPAQFPHKCNLCGHEQNFTIRYPYQSFDIQE